MDSAEASRRLTQYGLNVLKPRRQRAIALQFLSKFGNPLVLLLLAAASISALTGDVASFVIIALVVGLSVTLDFVQEYRAGQAAERLKQSVALRATIVRDGKPEEATADRIVPGDVVQLRLGGMVPADGRVLEARDFFVNQALLTGEPYPIEKSPGDLGDKPVDLAAASNAVFMGTSVVSGNGLHSRLPDRPRLGARRDRGQLDHQASGDGVPERRARVRPPHSPARDPHGAVRHRS